MDVATGAGDDEHGQPDGLNRTPKHIMSKFLGSKEEEWAALTHHSPLNLLDLPVDILKEIIREVTHTNDLTSLAVAHSALHALAIPQIYSRFDIVWPDGHTTTDSRTGVDALTYGLATLVMAKDVFGEGSRQKYSHHHIHRCSQCGRLDQCPHPAKPASEWRKTRRGNDFAQYTRKFSLGNGPADWMQEYLITKEGGKMLGTLVALAVGRMRNLETFIWDMPTGVLRDVWLALGSLADRDDGQESRLERIWVRWHDNSDASSPPANPSLVLPGSHLVNTLAIPGLSPSLFQIPPYPRVEFPTFSILPPLKSLSVLDIDELPYVQEMSILIERSFLRLRELRVGLAQHAQSDTWASLPEDKIHVAPPTTDNASSSPGGLLGVLLGGLIDAFGGIDMSDQNESAVLDAASADHVQEARATSPPPTKHPFNGGASNGPILGSSESTFFHHTPTAKQMLEIRDSKTPTLESKMYELTDSLSTQRLADALNPNRASYQSTLPPSSPLTLKLDVLELERVSISIPILSKAIDWSNLTTLTVLGCRHHDQLWKALRRRFSPRLDLSSPSPSRTSPLKSPRTRSTPQLPVNPFDYPLRLKRFHTDSVSTSLIAFLKDTLAPDTLEWLFLQDNRMYTSSVTIDQIYRGPLRRHKASLRKLLINSGDRTDDDGGGTGGAGTRSRRWTLTREVLTFILGGRMSCLRELSVVLDYKDWHFFLQRLPCIPHLRSLYIPHVSEHVHGRNLDSRELALQILDVVALRPELELCYLGIETKCFEMLEYAAGHKPSLSNLASASHGSGVEVESEDDSENDDGDAGHHHQPHSSSDHDFEDLGSDEGASMREDGETDAEEEMAEDEDARSRRAKAKVFKLREILFYDDKVSIFKARHGRL